VSDILTGFLGAALIDNIAGDDTRFKKMVAASLSVSEELKAEPRLLIPAILAGINPDISPEDPAIKQAKSALIAEWKTMETVYSSPPIGLYRAILLEACNQAAEEGNNAAILWLVAADTFYWMKLGKEETIVRALLEEFSLATEKLAIHSHEVSKPAREKVIKMSNSLDVELTEIEGIDKDDLHPKIGDAAGNSHVKLDGTNSNAGNANRYGTNQIPNWAGDFAIRMSDLLASELNTLAEKAENRDQELLDGISVWINGQSEALEQFFNEQRLFIQRVAKSNIDEQKAEQTRLNVLWWSEALYSSPLRKSYRELEPHLAAALMPIDLLTQITLPAPASVSYMLSETVCKLPNANFDKEELLEELLVKLRSLKNTLPTEVFEGLIQPASEGFLTLRDLVILALTETTSDLEILSKRAGITSDFKISLPVLSRAIFRQEQAFLLAEEA
jgi:hypothetical protein